MNFNLKKFGLTVGLIGCVAGPLIGLSAPQAGAIPAVSHPARTLVAVGSDTTYWVTGAIQKSYNADKTAVNTDHDVANNVPPVVVAPFPQSYVTRKDVNCASKRYASTNLPPNGSSAGISALGADTTGCIDYARSSREKRGTDPASLEFYAYGLDGLSWGRFPGSNAPANLTQQQLINIYTCNPGTGAPFVDDWHDLDASVPAGSFIEKYAPQTSSGTYSFWNSKILNGATVDAGCDAGHKSTFLEEHDARGITAAHKPNAIYPFSFAQWTAQKNAVSPDLRNGITLGSINGLAPSLTTIHEAAVPTRFLGTRYIFNVAKNTGPTYDDVIRFIGVDNAGPGWLCNNKAAATIKKYGFTPLAKATTGGGITIKTYCRFNPAAL